MPTSQKRDMGHPGFGGHVRCGPTRQPQLQRFWFLEVIWFEYYGQVSHGLGGLILGIDAGAVAAVTRMARAERWRGEKILRRINSPLVRYKTQRLGYYTRVSSIRIECVRYVVYPNDHAPCHVHGSMGRTRVVLSLLGDGNVCVADRKDRIKPKNAKASDVRKVLTLAADNFEVLMALWEKTHGKA